MKSKMFGMICCAAAALALGCNTNPAAESERDRANQEAERVREDSTNRADAIRDADGRTILGTAETPEAERRADAVEAGGERRADQIEDAGERRADEIERNDRDGGNGT